MPAGNWELHFDLQINIDNEIFKFTLTVIIRLNTLNANVALTQKPVNWSAVQINWLVSIWG